MLGDEYFSRVYHDEFLAWYAQSARTYESMELELFSAATIFLNLM